MCIRMKSRVTITLDPLAHQMAKRTARTRNTSVSQLIESLLLAASKPDPGLIVDEMIGSAQLRSPEPGSDPRYDALRDKYLKP